LDWKRVVQIAAYLLQKEVVDAPDRLDDYFREIYEPKNREPGREWPPKVPRVVGYERSEYPTFSNILIHVNGARIEKLRPAGAAENGRAANLVFDEKDEDLNFAVIDGQHRVNGAYLAVNILNETEKPKVQWDVPAEIFIDLDKKGEPPRRQAQIFIDVNFYQKKVDRSLVADLFPTARGERGPLDNKERAQDLGRKLMLEIGPLVGMIQIPGIKYGVKDVVTLATLNQAIEEAIPHMIDAGLDTLELQASFLAQCLDAWLNATGRKRDLADTSDLDPANVAYQGRVIVSFLTLTPACIWKLQKRSVQLISDDGVETLETWLKSVMKHAGLLQDGEFLDKSAFKEKGFLGSGGLGQFRDTLWAAAISTERVDDLRPDALSEKASANRRRIEKDMERK
jgi:DGQHR domain-containing protein